MREQQVEELTWRELPGVLSLDPEVASGKEATRGLALAPFALNQSWRRAAAGAAQLGVTSFLTAGTNGFVVETRHL